MPVLLPYVLLTRVLLTRVLLTHVLLPHVLLPHVLLPPCASSRTYILLTFSRFDTIHACDRRRDGRTDGIGVVYTRYSIYAVERKNDIFLLKQFRQ